MIALLAGAYKNCFSSLGGTKRINRINLATTYGSGNDINSKVLQSNGKTLANFH